MFLQKLNRRRRAALSLALGLIVALTAALLPLGAACAEIRESVFRLHVIANSDSAEDQALKLRVRDALLEKTGDLFREASDAAEAERIAREALPLLTETARAVLIEAGCRDAVSVTVGAARFGTREYEDFALPAGEYRALRVVIGEGKGKNWWCVLFPAVCLPSASASIDEALDPAAAALVKDKTVYRPAFAVVEWFESLREKWKF